MSHIWSFISVNKLRATIWTFESVDRVASIPGLLKVPVGWEPRLDFESASRVGATSDLLKVPASMEPQSGTLKVLAR